MDPKSFTVFNDDTAALKQMKQPITLDLWPTEAKDKRSMKGDLTIGNSLGFTVTASRSGGFCDKEVELTSGSVAPRMFALSAPAKNEKLVATKVLNDLSYWDCQEKKGMLILASPQGSVTFLRVEDEDDDEDVVIAA